MLNGSRFASLNHPVEVLEIIGEPNRLTLRFHGYKPNRVIIADSPEMFETSSAYLRGNTRSCPQIPWPGLIEPSTEFLHSFRPLRQPKPLVSLPLGGYHHFDDLPL